MILERTLHMLQAKADTKDEAEELGRMGYIQWLGWLEGGRGYAVQAEEALQTASAFRGTDPAIEAFCTLIETSLAAPLRPLELGLQKTRRRGGARRRRQRI